jgi:regulator of cell morphogenesis and NO signaling
MYQTKNIRLTPDLKISDIILNNPYLLLFLEHFGVDLPTQDKTLKSISDEYNISIPLIMKLVNLYNGVQYLPDDELSFSDTKPIISFLKNSHKFYTDEIYPEILSIIEQMAEVNDSKEMALVKKFFLQYFSEVTEHLEYEDNVVFPYVMDLHDQIQKGEDSKNNKVYSVVEYREQHNDIEEKLDDLKKLLIKYLPHKNDRVLRRKLILSLFELEYDLNVHAEIEDLILIPLVVKMETQLNQVH